MGMDYQFAGSASYPRFNDELKAVIELFSGKMETSRKHKDECAKYAFPEGTAKVLCKWANKPYDELTVAETEKLYSILKTKWNEVEAVSEQIAYEFDCLHSWGLCWSIC